MSKGGLGEITFIEGDLTGAQNRNLLTKVSSLNWQKQRI